MDVALPSDGVLSAQPDTRLTTTMVRGRACNAAFAGPLVTNSLRGLVAEAIVASAIEPEWSWCAADWASWDFERNDGRKLEVKQSASRQTWATAASKPSPCRFDIKERTGHYIGADWHVREGRVADIYVFAHHFVCDASADHCEPDQWRFFVVAEPALPRAKTIGLTAIARLAKPCELSELLQRVSGCAERLEPTQD